MLEVYSAASEIKGVLKAALNAMEKEKKVLVELKAENPDMFIMDRRYSNHKANYFFWKGKAASYCEIVAILVANKVAGAGVFYPPGISYDPLTFQVLFEEIEEDV